MAQHDALGTSANDLPGAAARSNGLCVDGSTYQSYLMSHMNKAGHAQGDSDHSLSSDMLQTATSSDSLTETEKDSSQPSGTAAAPPPSPAPSRVIGIYKLIVPTTHSNV